MANLQVKSWSGHGQLACRHGQLGSGRRQLGSRRGQLVSRRGQLVSSMANLVRDQKCNGQIKHNDIYQNKEAGVYIFHRGNAIVF